MWSKRIEMATNVAGLIWIAASFVMLAILVVRAVVGSTELVEWVLVGLGAVVFSGIGIGFVCVLGWIGWTTIVGVMQAYRERTLLVDLLEAGPILGPVLVFALLYVLYLIFDFQIAR